MNRAQLELAFFGLAVAVAMATALAFSIAGLQYFSFTGNGFPWHALPRFFAWCIAFSVVAVAYFIFDDLRLRKKVANEDPFQRLYLEELGLLSPGPRTELTTADIDALSDDMSTTVELKTTAREWVEIERDLNRHMMKASETEAGREVLKSLLAAFERDTPSEQDAKRAYDAYCASRTSATEGALVTALVTTKEFRQEAIKRLRDEGYGA